MNCCLVSRKGLWGNEQRFSSPLNDMHTYGQRLTTVKSSSTLVKSNITKNGPTSTRANDDDQRTASLAARQVRPRSSYSKETTLQRQHWPVKDDMKYTYEKHKTTARPANSHYRDCEEKSVANLDYKLRWTQESERKVEIYQTDRLSNMSSLNSKYFEFERYYNYKACRKILHGKNGKLQYDAHIARCLISDLINFNDFQADLGMLSTKQDKDPNELIPLLKDNAGIFSLIVHSPTKATVRLRPKIRYCSDWVSAECENVFCFAVHVCPYYIFDTCRVKNCKFGHALRTTKSNYIFKSFYLDSFSENVLKGIVRKIWAGTVYPKLCLAYNTEICTALICMDLHLCYKHVMSLGLCPGVHTYCPVNHDIYDPCCEKVFKHFNISTNETPRDLMKYVMYTTKSLLSLSYYCEATDKKFTKKSF